MPCKSTVKKIRGNSEKASYISETAQNKTSQIQNSPVQNFQTNFKVKVTQLFFTWNEVGRSEILYTGY